MILIESMNFKLNFSKNGELRIKEPRKIGSIRLNINTFNKYFYNNRSIYVSRQRQGYVVIDQKRGYSQYNGRPYITIEFIGIWDRLIYKTYIQKSNRNERYWAYVLDHVKSGIVVQFLNFEIQDEQKRIISADSTPAVVIAADPEILAQELEHYWQTQDRRSNNPVFDQLFEVKR